MIVTSKYVGNFAKLTRRPRNGFAQIVNILRNKGLIPRRGNLTPKTAALLFIGLVATYRPRDTIRAIEKNARAVNGMGKSLLDTLIEIFSDSSLARQIKGFSAGMTYPEFIILWGDGKPEVFTSGYEPDEIPAKIGGAYPGYVLWELVSLLQGDITDKEAAAFIESLKLSYDTKKGVKNAKLN